ncbi:leucine-rich repeat protein [Duncaniella muris]|uniref:leucine-rich repeat protein n=1 Tax=Duncaniella muris TaxID=2094150 RepID=UPI003F68113E
MNNYTDGVTTIGDHAFSGCSGLTSITIQIQFKQLGVVRFWGCSGLTSITIPSGATTIGNMRSTAVVA